MADKPSGEDCARCGEPISSRTPSEGVTQRIMMNRTIIRWRLHFERFHWVWLPRYADERVSGRWTELILCDWCAGDVFLFAQGLAPREKPIPTRRFELQPVRFEKQ